MMTLAVQPASTPDLAPAAEVGVSMMDLLNQYAHIGVVAFAVTLLVTPLVRRLALRHDIVDHPDLARKNHGWPVAYLGGVAIFLGVLSAIIVSFPGGGVADRYDPVPVSIILGMIAITFTGLADDVWGWDPRLKIAGQLVAAAALAIQDVGVRVADGLLAPLLGDADTVLITLGSMQVLNGDIFYWVGTAIIAIFVLGGCNAANLIDGLDGLLSGTVAIVALGLLVISLLMCAQGSPTASETDALSLGGTRLVLCLALLGAVLGFLPHNFNPATIFLGDCGSLLLGYLCVVIILMLGEYGQTHLVFAGLIVFALPIMDTMLAIIRRKLTGRSMSDADDQHIHHHLKRALRGVRRAVIALYGISAAFALLGVTLAALVMLTELRVRVVYAIALMLFGFIGAVAFKTGHRHQHEMKPQPAETPASTPDAAAATDDNDDVATGDSKPATASST